MKQIHSAVRELARNHGVITTEGEIIGLIPQEAWEQDAEWLGEIRDFDPEAKVLERRLEHPLPWPAA
jgi:glutamate formiminotransferase